METAELLSALDRFHGGIPEKLLLEAVGKGKAMAPELFGAIQEVVKKPQVFLDDPERNLYYWAAYLLVHFEAVEGQQAIVELLKFAGGKFEPLIEDLLEDVPMLLANTCGDNFQPIVELLRESKVETLREGAADALGLLFLWGELPREIIVEEFRRTVEGLKEEDQWLGATIAMAAIELDLRELGPALLEAYDRDAVDRDFADMEYFAEWQHDPDFEGPPPYVTMRQGIDDIVEFFEEKVQEAKWAEGKFGDEEEES